MTHRAASPSSFGLWQATREVPTLPPRGPAGRGGALPTKARSGNRQREAATARAARPRRGEASGAGLGAAGRGGRERTDPSRSRSAASAAMGLETEKADVQLFMADDAYSHHSGVDYVDPEKYVDSNHDRDPHRLNSHLKVSFSQAITQAGGCGGSLTLCRRMPFQVLPNSGPLVLLASC